MKRILACLIILFSVWFCFAEPQVTHEEHKEQKIIMISSTKLTFDYKVPAGWHVVCISAIDINNIVIVLEKN